MANSSIIMLELNRIFDEKKKKLALGIMETLSRAELSLTKEVELRAKDFQNYGVKIFDSYHLAIAEFAQIEHLITVDDQFINAAKRTNAKVKVVNPMMFIMEELKNE
jgi:predicted nucleic acid-binding protein